MRQPAALVALSAVQASYLQVLFVRMQLPVIQTQPAGEAEAGSLVSREPGIA